MARNKIVDELVANIVQSHDIREQADLRKILKKHGCVIPQATLSRLLNRLKIAKVSGVYKLAEPIVLSLPKVLNIQTSEFGFIVLKTLPGNANSIAYYIDQKYVSYDPLRPKKNGILGTIAGDDTVLLLLQDKACMPKILALLKKEFAYLK